MSERTYLRVRRKRSACAAAETLRLRGLDSHPYAPPYGTSDATIGSASNTKPSNKRVAVWRRVEDTETSEANRKRSYRVVDAVLEEELPDDDNNNDDNDDEAPRSAPDRKRPRLTLLATSDTVNGSSKNKRSNGGIKILNPAERMVDDSLQQVFQGNRIVSEHYQFLLTDPRLADQWRRWCIWHNAESGNLLHACALWNEYDIMNELLRVLLSGNTSSTYDSLLLNRFDREGRTPYQIATLCKHEQVCQVLEAYGAGDYLVDLYALEENDDDEHNMHELCASENDDELEGGSRELACELKGGIGYWNEKGQLILQQSLPHTMSDVTLRDEDESIDSNHEDWDGNDYPDFEEAEDIGNGGYDEDGDSEHANFVVEGIGDEFGINSSTMRQRAPLVVEDPYGDFDAAYGVYGQYDTEEYDCEL